uniref:ATP synthase F0 subunit 8 n=1 Tax=Psilodens balduri TaxID=1494734 RepID=A0A2U8LL42_9MOLL|nr:ATP synthase F0 subunit 8 [Psilodens balduri]
MPQIAPMNWTGFFIMLSCLLLMLVITNWWNQKVMYNTNENSTPGPPSQIWKW